MIRKAPASTAPWMQFRPTPPQPTTATVLPGSTLAVFSTAPIPVVTPQPIRASCSKGMSSSTLTTACSWTSICSAKEPNWAIWVIRVPPCLRRGGSESERSTSGRRHRLGRPLRHRSQWPQNTDKQVMTRSPGFT